MPEGRGSRTKRDVLAVEAIFAFTLLVYCTRYKVCADEEGLDDGVRLQMVTSTVIIANTAPFLDPAKDVFDTVVPWVVSLPPCCVAVVQTTS